MHTHTHIFTHTHTHTHVNTHTRGGGGGGGESHLFIGQPRHRIPKGPEKSGVSNTYTQTGFQSVMIVLVLFVKESKI